MLTSDLVCAGLDRVVWPRNVPRPSKSVVRVEHHHGAAERASEFSVRIENAGVWAGVGTGATANEARASAIVDYAARYDQPLNREAVLHRLQARTHRRTKKR